jgi:hypothetical protein
VLRLDHLAVTATDLAAGVAAVEAALGLTLAPGGQHPHMATHNRLLHLGDVYLEVIAPDPGQPRPAWPRWFDLDRLAGPPRLTHWVAASDALEADIAAAPAGIGVPLALSRGDLAWRMAVPADGILPFGGGFPALIAWQGTAHPVARLPDVGARLARLTIAHPEAPALRAALAGRLADPRITVVEGPAVALEAEIATPQGLRRL